VRVYVPEPWLGHIKLGDPMKPALIRLANKGISRPIEQIAAPPNLPSNVQTVEDRIKQVFGVKVRLDNREGLLRAGDVHRRFFPRGRGGVEGADPVHCAANKASRPR